jgi:hypothetical protein
MFCAVEPDLPSPMTGAPDTERDKGSWQICIIRMEITSKYKWSRYTNCGGMREVEESWMKRWQLNIKKIETMRKRPILRPIVGSLSDSRECELVDKRGQT